MAQLEAVRDELRRRDDVLVEHLGHELLIFDPTSNRAHSLNAASALVWDACDGVRDRDRIADHTGLAIDLVDLALDGFRNCDLLTGTPELNVPRASRRAALRKAA